MTTKKPTKPPKVIVPEAPKPLLRKPEIISVGPLPPLDGTLHHVNANYGGTITLTALCLACGNPKDGVCAACGN